MANGWKTKMARKARQPRSTKATAMARKSSQRLNKASESRRLMKMRIVELETRLTVLERLVESINTPALQARADHELAQFYNDKMATVFGSAEEE